MDVKKNVRRKLLGVQGAEILELDCDILIPCAMENAITATVAKKVKAKLVACGGNGTNTSKAEKILETRGIPVLYDFLANSAGVTASYFEWLRNLVERFIYEAEVIRRGRFNIDVMDPYIMPEFRSRIKDILLKKESSKTTTKWNNLLRDIMITAVNDDYSYAKQYKISMKTAGLVNAICRVFTAVILKEGQEERHKLWNSLPQETKRHLKEFFFHPEAVHHNQNAEKIFKNLTSFDEI
jgi:glutamate dehydrogenase/leucine dehydrogenase